MGGRGGGRAHGVGQVGAHGPALLAPPEQLHLIRMDALATVAYVANWRAVFSGYNYWALFTAPSPLAAE